MADVVEEPQFTSVSARIAALKQQQGFNRTPTLPTGKRPPPPPPPSSSSTRPGIEARSKTTNNPPLASYGSSVTKRANNEPIGINGLALRPPPPVDRDHVPEPDDEATAHNQVARIPPKLPARNAPPPLPSRKASEPSPSLPPRNLSAPVVARRGSNASTISHSSTVSGMSLSQGESSRTSASSVETQRRLPPALGDTKLPPLPPTRRELDEKVKATKNPLVSTKSAPNVLRGRPSIPDIRPGLPPRVPSRPGRNPLPEDVPRPALPARPSRTNLKEDGPIAAARRLPPPAVARSALNMGFNNKPKPVESTKPVQNGTNEYHPPGQVLELTDADFDSHVMAGTPALVDFYAPYCRYCKELDPVYEELARNVASPELLIVKVDVDAHKSFLDRYDIKGYPTLMLFDGSNQPPKKYQFGRDLESLTRFIKEETGISPKPISDGVPPPINKSSKPSFAQVQAVKARPVLAPVVAGCLLCRDFSGPDSVATQHPRQSLPRVADISAYLAQVLCGPFESATDKARAIFTWLHHNIAYDVDAFFGNRVKHVDPRDTIASGVAVCGGYAGVYSAIALKAGLECVMVTGHGKGYGYSAMKAGDPVPRCDPSGHAWNAVRIDNGEWKLLDACWGAGNVGEGVYNKHFTPSCFTSSNDDFGLKHFPQDDAYFFRSDRRALTWEEYMIGPVGGEPVQLYGCVEDHGLSATSFSPATKQIPVRSGETVRFQFSKMCEHWDDEQHGAGRPYCMILQIHGLDGRKDDFVALDANATCYWADVEAERLGCRGQTVSVYAVTTVDGRDARGLSRREYLAKKGKCGMGFAGIALWELV
ncbi:transglutaminase-like superfamily protein [Phlyctema vagabunda]|uniref:Transglutaminase-like superfamily protein n=1 Tax=Phlyctema vagabunda TaxID=108571 RepID=A0ABR4PCV8_9HELO